MPPADVETRPSPIAGRGVFATDDVPIGTAVVGELNHSCDPNCWFDGDTLVTRRAVGAGEELTFDYATGTTELFLMCHCESYRCRQLIAGDDWAIPQLQQRYTGHWAPPLQRLIDAESGGPRR